jgi:acyl-CoA thioester hydrolase
MVPARHSWISTAGASVDAPFRFRHSVAVRFRDIDVGGHAHHSQALVYFEEARAAYWREVVGRTGALDVDYIMAEARIRWHQRVLWPQVLSVGVRVSRLGRKHFEMEYEACDADGTRLQSGSSTQVMYDYAAGATKRMPEDVRSAIEAFEGSFPDGGGIGGTPRVTG